MGLHDVEHALAQRGEDVVGHRLDARRDVVGPAVEVERDERERDDDQHDDRAACGATAVTWPPRRTAIRQRVEVVISTRFSASNSSRH